MRDHQVSKPGVEKRSSETQSEESDREVMQVNFTTAVI